MEKQITEMTNWLAQIEAIVFEKANQGATIPKSNIPLTIEVIEEREEPEEYIAGLKISSSVKSKVSVPKENPAAQEFVKQFEKAQKKQSELETLKTGHIEFKLALEALNLQPIAIIPKKVWQKITNQCDLYRFEHFQNQRQVLADLEFLVDLIFIRLFSTMPVIIAFGYLALAYVYHASFSASILPTILCSFMYPCLILGLKANNIKVAAPSYLCAFLFFVASTFSSFFFAFRPAYNAAYLAMMIISYLFMAIALFSVFSTKFRKFISLIIFPLLSRKTIIKTLWPEKITCHKKEYGHSDIEDLRLVTPIFPEPTEEFKKLLITLRPNAGRLCLAAESGAIGIEAQEIKTKALKLIELDPIVYIKSQNEDFVAILGQFGKFKNEKRAIEMVRSLKPEDLI